MMTAFIAKQFVGKQLESVKGALGEKEEKDEKTTVESEDDVAEIAEARREAEEKRKEKYRKMEEDREKMRQEIRDKYGLKKKDDSVPAETDVMDSEMQKSATSTGAVGQPDIGGEQGFVLPKSFEELTSKATQLSARMVANIESTTDRCAIA